jgi:hypothetical protein
MNVNSKKTCYNKKFSNEPLIIFSTNKRMSRMMMTTTSFILAHFVNTFDTYQLTRALEAAVALTEFTLNRSQTSKNRRKMERQQTAFETRSGGGHLKGTIHLNFGK